MPAPLEAAKREAILVDIRAAADGTAEQSAGAIARAHHVAASTVTRLAKANGLEHAWQRTQTAHASRATTVDNRARRAALSAGMLDDAEHLRGRLREATIVVTATGSKVTLPLPPAGDARAFMGAVATAVKTSLEVDKRDAEEDSHTAVDEWLRGIVGAGVGDALTGLEGLEGLEAGG